MSGFSKSWRFYPLVNKKKISSSLFILETVSHFVVQIGLEFLAGFLPQPPKCWDFRYELPCLPWKFSCFNQFMKQFHKIEMCQIKRNFLDDSVIFTTCYLAFTNKAISF